MTPEAKVKKEIKEGLDRIGAYYFMPVQTGYGKRTLDFLVCWHGLFIGIECKAGNNKPTKQQEEIVKQIEFAEGIAFVAHSWQECYLKLPIYPL